MPQFIPVPERTQMVRLYQQGWSSVEIGRMFGHHQQTVVNISREFGVGPKLLGQPRQHQLDETFFDSIDTEEKAYWLGFIAADGCVQARPRCWTCEISTAHKDSGHLAKFVAALKSDFPVRSTAKGDTSEGVTITSKRLVTALLQLGITPRKSFTAVAWYGPDELMHHYWRGVVDGDGWIFPNTNRAYWNVGVTGSKPMCESFQRFIRTRLGIPTRVGPNDVVWKVEVGGISRPQLVVQLLYKNASVFLDRKKALADRLLQQRPGKMRWLLPYEDTKVAELYLQGCSVEEVGRQLGITRAAAAGALGRKGIAIRRNWRSVSLPKAA